MPIKELNKTVFKEDEDELDFVLTKTTAADGSNLTFLVDIVVNDEVIWSMTVGQLSLACHKTKRALEHEIALMWEEDFGD